MAMVTINTPSSPVEVEGWLPLTQAALFERWFKTTGHRSNARFNTWACEIANRCRTCDEHLSIPCSILREANEIGTFLESACYSDEPAGFLRLYLVLLSEFVNQLKDLSRLVKIKVEKPPKLVVVWANRWAKHRLGILVQHHPAFIFADKYGTTADQFFAELADASLTDSCGFERPLQVIDTQWLSGHDSGTPDLNEANDGAQAIVTVPPLMSFMDEVIKYFRHVIDRFVESPEAVKRFESKYVRRGCYG